MEKIASGVGSAAIAQISSRASQTSQSTIRTAPVIRVGRLVPGRAARAGQLPRARQGPLVFLGLIGEQDHVQSEPGRRGKEAEDRRNRWAWKRSETAALVPPELA